MKFELIPHSIDSLVKAFRGGSLARNPEYQRGSAWHKQQKQALIDSIFRKYPLPAFFFEVKETIGLGDESAKKYEIIDGQQRLLALAEYLADDFDLLRSEDVKLRLPLSMRGTTNKWEGKRFSELGSEVQKDFLEEKIQVYLVQEVENSDEVRDLFIRLQSGTALTRQQIRDAWPGQLGPRVEKWAGKLSKHPKYNFFDSVDGRGTRDDEDDTSDTYVKHRTTCAQLCQLLLSRAENAFATPSIKSGDLDSLYHRYTQVSAPNNPLDEVEVIFQFVQEVIDNIASRPRGRKKVSKITLFALSMFIQDVRRSERFKLTTESKMKLADAVSEPNISQNSRAVSGGVINAYYESWRARLPEGTGVELDRERSFNDGQRGEIRKMANGLCSVCGEVVLPDDEEFDHYPIPYRDGGKTAVDNGRLVHKECHPRGRPKS